MIITLIDTDVDTVLDEGSVVAITGTDEDGQRVRFGADARMIEPVLRALVMDEEFEIPVEVEDWQVLGIFAVEAP